MQTTDTIADKPAATANNGSPTPSPTQQPVTPAPAAAPPTAPTAPADIDPDLLAIADELAAKVRECQVASLGWLIQAGERLRDYRDQLHPDDWAQVLRSGRLPVGARMAQMLVRIARHKVMRNGKRTHQLPDSVTILNQIAGLPVAVLEQALDSGVIHRNTSLKQAQCFVQERLGRTPPPVTPPATPPLQPRLV